MSAIDLERQLEDMILRLAVTQLVYRDVTVYVDQDELVDRVVENVVRGWRCRKQGAPTELGGPDGYWNQYANRVEFAPASSGDTYRAEFCPDVSQPFDEHDYYRAVWHAHIAGLSVTGAAVGIDNDSGTCRQSTN
ncbi:hypothetical protein [Rugosimonospora africana]|uniref:Uncharacterized protein n=1 Tax=Rugosimonospora africana TaxID=556532 RepID=A0A8J3QZC6_9ACTN|nr:hypothetical protein [Rugosimonospora africana]GIH19683.1 hypothetical protein Raf01_78550 [Rugosimonospora africana]